MHGTHQTLGSLPPDGATTFDLGGDPSGPLRLFEDLQAPDASEVERYVNDDAIAAPPWSEEDIVLIHWLLLKQVQRLAEPETPLEEKIWTLNWVFTDPDKEALPFSFANCVKVVSLSPLSPLPFIGAFDVGDLRDVLAHGARRWIRDSVQRFPDWIQELIRRAPAKVLEKLERNPQYLNQQVRDRQLNGDLFA